MSIKLINESFGKIAHPTPYTNKFREALGDGASEDKFALADALFNAVKTLKDKGVTELKEYEYALQAAIESQFPDTDWFDVTSVNIFWDLMNTKDPEQTAINILADIYRPEETVETEETVEVTEDTVKRGGKRMNVGKDGSHGVVYIGNAKIVSREELPKVGDKNERGDSTVTLVKRVADEDGHEIYHVYYTENDALDLIEPNEEPDVDTAIWSFAVPIDESKKPMNETADGAQELWSQINNNEYAYNKLAKIVSDCSKKGWSRDKIVVAVRKAIYSMKDDFGRIYTTQEERHQLAKDFVDDELGSDKETVTESKKKCLKEEFKASDKKASLAKYIGVPEETIKETRYDSNSFETEDGEEYLVLDEDEAHKYAKEDIEVVYDDLGMESFTKTFQEWILNNAVKKDWFEDALEEYQRSYIDDIEYEDDYSYGNRLVQEMVDADILSDDDFEKDADGNVDYASPKDSTDMDSKKEDFIEYLVEQAGDPIQWYRDMVGDKDFAETVKENGLIDLDAVEDEAISLDGVAHFIATYDGEEIDLGDGLFAYRTN